MILRLATANQKLPRAGIPGTARFQRARGFMILCARKMRAPPGARCQWIPLVWIYSRHPNLIPLAFSHSLTTLMILASLSKSLTGSMRVGHAYFRL